MERDLGIARRRRRSPSTDGELPQPPLRAKPSTPAVTPADIESLKAQLSSMNGELLSLQEQISGLNDNETIELQGSVAEIREDIEILNALATRTAGEVEILITRLAAFDIGEYQVEEFPI